MPEILDVMLHNKLKKSNLRRRLLDSVIVGENTGRYVKVFDIMHLFLRQFVFLLLAE